MKRCDTEDPLIFAPSHSTQFAGQVAKHAGLALSPLEEREFEDGEHKIRPLCSVRGRCAFVVHSLYGEPAASPNDKLCRLLFLIAALRDAGADRIMAVLPYLAYARKDQRSQTRDPVTSRYMAQILESVGVDAVVTIDVHNRAAFQNAFRCPVVTLDTVGLLAQHVAQWVSDRTIHVVSPDLGGVKRAEALRERLTTLTQRDIGAAFMEKYRSLGKVTGDTLVGDVSGADVVILDDLISTGGTIARTAAACRKAGAVRVAALATHGLFVGDAEHLLGQAQLDDLIVTDTVPPFRLSVKFIAQALRTVSVAPLFAATLTRLHRGRSIVELLEQPI